MASKKRSPKVGESKTRTVYKRRGLIHVCHDGEYFSPKDATSRKQGDKVAVESTKAGSFVLVSYALNTSEGGCVQERWSYDRILAGKVADPKTGRKVGERKPPPEKKKEEPLPEQKPEPVDQGEDALPPGTVIDVLSGDEVDLSDDADESLSVEDVKALLNDEPDAVTDALTDAEVNDLEASQG